MRATLQAKKRQLVKDAIWEAAAGLFSVQGYDETTVEEIVQAAGVSQRSFFRYFSSKSDLMAHSMESYAASLVETIESCPPDCTPAQVFRRTVLLVARASAAHPNTRRTMEIIARYPAARAAETSRIPELQDRVCVAYSRRPGVRRGDELAPMLLAGLTLQVLAVVLHSWFSNPGQDVDACVNHTVSTLDRLLCREG